MVANISCMGSCRQAAVLLAPILIVLLVFWGCQCNWSECLFAVYDFLPTPGSIFTDIIMFSLAALCSLLGLRLGSSTHVASAVRKGLPKIGAAKTDSACKHSQSRASYAVCAPLLGDVTSLQQLYDQDYVQAHIKMHPSVGKGVSVGDWEEALGPVDFEAVICAQTKTPGDVRLLKCVQIADSVPPEEQAPLGYILYELRAKGSPGKKPQRYCEIVNVVVGHKQQGGGLGRLLFEEMVADIEKSAKSHCGDLRLFVAKENARPLEWYRRLGFQDAGWQKECLGGKSDVSFLRMTRKSSSAKP